MVCVEAKPTAFVVWADSSLASTLCRALHDLKTHLPDFKIVGLVRGEGSLLTNQWLDQKIIVEEEALEALLPTIVANASPYLVIPTSEKLLVELKGIGTLTEKTLGPDRDLALRLSDKWLTYELFRELKLPFCESTLPSRYQPGMYDELIVKPRRGERSEGIKRNPLSTSDFSDDWVVQRLIRGQEYTVGVYVFRNGSFKFISLVRNFCEGGSAYLVSVDFDQRLISLFTDLIQGLGIAGIPFNFQFLEQGGEIHPIEINPRFSSSNWVRMQFGFQDVRWALEEHLFEAAPSIGSQATLGKAVSLRMDLIL